MLLLSLFSGCSVNDGRITINVYNWGQYISEGDDGCIDVIAEFERLNPDIRVNYVTFDSNETMYTKMAGGGITVDVIIPSDYMVARLIEEDMLLPLNFDNIPNYAKIDETYKARSFDPDNEYCVPYTWGLVGIVYNTTMVDDPVTSWTSLWDPRYSGQILMFNNSRDAMAIAMQLTGSNPANCTKEDIDKMTAPVAAPAADTEPAPAADPEPAPAPAPASGCPKRFCRRSGCCRKSAAPVCR